MRKVDFLKVANIKYEVDGYTIQYSDQPNYEWYAVVNGEFVDVSEYEWSDFDGFVEAVIEEYQKWKILFEGGNENEADCWTQKIARRCSW